MNILKMGDFIDRVKKTFNRETVGSLKYINRALSKTEKTILVVSIFVLVGVGIYIWRDSWLKNTHEVANFGGTFSEGIVGEPKDLEKHITRLTNIGLTRAEENGSISGDLAESWEIIDDGKTYKFKLRKGFNSEDLKSQIEAKNIWPNIEIEATDSSLLVFKFKQPFSPFLYATTEAIFPYGPYKVIKQEKTKVILEAQDDYWRGKAHIEKIIVHLYANNDDLLKAIRHREVMGYVKKSKDEVQEKSFHSYEMNLPREMVLFFNLSRADLQKNERRQNLRDGKPIDADLNWTLVTSDKEKNVKKAEEIKEKWKALRVNLIIKKYNNATLQKEIIPKRDYDVLLFGLDYGSDPDPYPFWHSSQNKAEGMNLSNFSNKKADRLLEEARQTYDFKTREDKYNQFREILNSEVPYISLDKDLLYYAVSDKVQGIKKIFGFSETDRFLGVDDWFIKTKRIKN